MNQSNQVVSADNQPQTDPGAPRHPEFLPPGEQQTRHDAAERPRHEVPSMPPVHEVPEKINPMPPATPNGPDRERA